jgi:hypothetical protein
MIQMPAWYPTIRPGMTYEIWVDGELIGERPILKVVRVPIEKYGMPGEWVQCNIHLAQGLQEALGYTFTNPIGVN